MIYKNSYNKVAYNDCYGGFGLSKRAIQWLGSHGIYDKYPGLEDLEKLPRHEPLLIECIEELGDAVNEDDSTNNIKVKTVYDTGYYISNDDGLERVITPSQMINFDDPLTVTNNKSASECNIPSISPTTIGLISSGITVVRGS